MGKKASKTNFFYMYETQLQDLSMNLLFYKLEVDILRTLEVISGQLHPNGVICHYLRMEPTAPKFLHYYVVQVGAKSMWVLLIGLSKTCLYVAYSTSYKGFKGCFVKFGLLVRSRSPWTEGRFPSIGIDRENSMDGLKMTC
ncbi:hypothetical protein CR513_52529, partial [Mucuna pruriens]